MQRGFGIVILRRCGPSILDKSDSRTQHTSGLLSTADSGEFNFGSYINLPKAILIEYLPGMKHLGLRNMS